VSASDGAHIKRRSSGESLHQGPPYHPAPTMLAESLPCKRSDFPVAVGRHDVGHPRWPLRRGLFAAVRRAAFVIAVIVLVQAGDEAAGLARREVAGPNRRDDQVADE
jgi:hypothetical protein